MTHWADNIRFEQIGDPEDWSARFTHKRTGKSLYLIDTGGTYLVVRNLDLYVTSGRGIIDEFRRYDEAAKYIQRAISQ